MGSDEIELQATCAKHNSFSLPVLIYTTGTVAFVLQSLFRSRDFSFRQCVRPRASRGSDPDKERDFSTRLGLNQPIDCNQFALFRKHSTAAEGRVQQEVERLVGDHMDQT